MEGQGAPSQSTGYSYSATRKWVQSNDSSTKNWAWRGI